MATSHSVSVLTNSCVKPPVNPTTGIPATEVERPRSHFSHTWDFEAESDQSDQENQPERRISPSEWRSFNEPFNLTATNPLIESLTQQLPDLDDEEFYQKLLELKKEHKRTLSMCEQLYKDELERENMRQSVGGVPYNLDTKHHEDMYTSPSPSKGTRDQVRDMSAAKPPAPPNRPRSSHGGRPMSAKARSSGTSMRRAWADRSPIDRKLTNGKSSDLSDEEEDWNDVYYNGGGLDTSRSLSSSMSRVEDMWENFSVEDYAPRERSDSRASSTSSTAQKKKEDKAAEWRHRITVPKPFKMTLRENNQIKPKKKTSAMIALEKELQDRKRQEEEECQKKFKAQPAPAHIYVPMFDQIMEAQESRRQLIRDCSQEILKSMEKPFKFTIREDEKKRHKRTQSMPIASEHTARKSKSFKARPPPKQMLDESIMDKIAEEEEYRKIRIRMRAEEMMKSASLPPSMESRGKAYTLGRSRSKLWSERSKKLGITSDHSFKPRINSDPPDFEAEHRKLQKQLSYKKLEKEATVCKPFNLRTERIPSRKHKVYEDIERDEETLNEYRWPYKNPRAKPPRTKLSLGALSSSWDNIPAKMTASAELRSSTTRDKLNTMVQKEVKELEKERQRRQKERRLQRIVAERAAGNDQTYKMKEEMRDKLKEKKAADRARNENYRQELNEMKERVDQRPLLFERTSQINARKAAERKYQETLQAAGFDEEYVRRKGSLAGSADISRDYDDDESDPGSYKAPVHDDKYGLSDGDRTPSEISDDEYA